MKILLLLCFTGAIATASDDVERGVVPEDFVQARPARASNPASGKPVYRPVAGNRPPGEFRQPNSRQVGVTIWRLRPAASADSGVRLLVQDDAGAGEWTPERIGSTTVLRPGDRVRLSIESPQAGYLYVIDRERYASGERGAPYLVFPTSRTRGGDNRVSPGKVVEIPGQEDRPNFFSVRPSRPDQVQEELTILLTSSPLDDLRIGSKPVSLSPATVAKWEKEWGGSQATVFELQGGAGKSWTAAEQLAGADGSRVLTQEDPPPQSIYRVIGAKASDPILVKVPLRYGRVR